MQLKQKEIDFIKKAFGSMEDRDDLLDLLNFVKPMIYGRKSVPLELKHLNFHANPKANPSRYRTFKIEKKTSGFRVIHSPDRGLKVIQSCLSVILQSVYTVSPSANGFIAGRSVLDNAKVHARSIFVYNIDLKDFFSSIDQARIWGRLQHPPFNLKGTKEKLSLANKIAAIACHGFNVERPNENGEWVLVKKNVLPQGAPSSPVLTNIICQQLDFYLAAAARRFGLRYSRYADDITFSSMHNAFQPEGDFITELHRIIREQNFFIKPEKTRLQKDGYRQSVTGLVVNRHPNLQKKYVNRVRQLLFFWESFGYDRANAYFGKKHKKEIGKQRRTFPQLSNVLEGKLNYLKMIKGSDDGTYKKLRARFDLINTDVKRMAVAKLALPSDINVRHSPVTLMRFLKYFKFDNKYSFKGLVHKPVDPAGFDFSKLLKKSLGEFNKMFLEDETTVSLPKKTVEAVKEFFEQLEEFGIPFFRRTGDHPLEDRTVGSLIQQFKGRYRFGNERNESSILSELIFNTARKRYKEDHTGGNVWSFGESDTSGQFSSNQINLLPDLVKFQSKANFFTWVPNVTMALSVIFDAILQHSNIDGSRDFTSNDKRITVEINKKVLGDNIALELSICDTCSIYMGNTDSIMKSMRREFLPMLNGISDFKINFKTADGRGYSCQVLPYQEHIEETTVNINGFTYLMTFYD